MTTNTLTPELIEAPAVRKDAAIEFQIKANDLSKRIDSLVIQDQSSYEEAAKLSKEVKDNIKLTETFQSKLSEPFKVGLKMVKDLFTSTLATLEVDKEIITDKLVSWDNEQKRIQKEAEDKLRREAEAEESRQRKVKEDQERQWREKEDAKRKEAEELAAQGKKEEAEKARREAEKAADKAKERAQEKEQISVVAPVVAPISQKPTGLHYQERWSGECVDLMALVKAVASGRASIMLLMANGPAINKQATATKNSLPIDGIKWVCTKTPVNKG